MATAASPLPYDLFAPIYDRHWRRFSAHAPEVLDRLLLDALPAGAHVLDLCCGTGQLAQVLLDRGYGVTGLDSSESMLEFARRNAPGASFILADARDFALDRPVDAVISTSDSLNHIIELPDLVSTLTCVRESLRPGGLFVFDMNTEEKYRRHWTGSFGIVDDDQVCVVSAVYDRIAGIARFDATLFFLTDAWERHDIAILERCYSNEELTGAMAAAGFSNVAVHDWQRDFDPNGEPAKIFVVGRA